MNSSSEVCLSSIQYSEIVKVLFGVVYIVHSAFVEFDVSLKI